MANGNGDGNGGKIEITSIATGMTKDKKYKVSAEQTFDSFKVPTKKYFNVADDHGKDVRLDEKDAESITITPGKP